jgi:hypothetical protein
MRPPVFNTEPSVHSAAGKPPPWPWKDTVVGYDTFFTGKWHLGEADYALPNAQGYDVMKYCGLYHLNAYTYGDPTWFPDMPQELRDMFNKVTKGAMSGNAGETAREDFKINGHKSIRPTRASSEYLSLTRTSKRLRSTISMLMDTQTSRSS